MRVTDTTLSDFKAKFRELAELREASDIAKAAEKKASKAYREAEAQLFAELEDAGITGRQSFDFGGDLGKISFQRRSTTYGRLIDKDAAIAALKEAGLDEMIFQESVREKRLNELVRDRLEAHADLPEGVDYYQRKGISISRKS